MKHRALIAAIVLALGAPAFGQGVRKAFRSEHKFTLAPGGSFVLENPVGNIDVIGVETADIGGIAMTTITARDDEALEEGRRQTTVLVSGDTSKRMLRSNVVPNHDPNWRASVDWSVRVPRSAHVRVISQTSARIRVLNMTGRVHVTNFSGQVVLLNDTGSNLVESVNGSLVHSTQQVGGNTVLSTVNGHITASLPANAAFNWVAETVKGDIRTNFPANGAFFGPSYRATMNNSGGPTISTVSITGNVQLFAQGQPVARARSVRAPSPSIVSAMLREGTVTSEPILRSFRYRTNLGDVKVAEVRGDADISTGAGEVSLGRVSGTAKVVSGGGPLHFGEVLGVLNASTNAGDILVESARRGGTLETRGGTIRVLNTFGPTRLISGGGDLIVRRAAAGVRAETSSGDIAITVDPGVRTVNLEAKTGKGNVVLYVAPEFAADVDATITTTDPAADTFVSDLPGLSVSREEVGGKTRVRAVGKLNGGGERVVLDVTSGDIRLITRAQR